MNRILGVGWINGSDYGGLRLGERRSLAAGATLSALWREPGLLPAAPRNVGRFNAATHLACGAVGLALRDAGVASSAGRTSTIGLLVATPDGCVAANRAYFADYLAGGRTLGRGNLFIYTLPTSAPAEAAICFGLRGPLVYVAPDHAPARGLIAMAAGMLGRGEADAMLALVADAAAGICFVVAPEAAVTHHGMPSVEEALGVVEAETSIEGLVGAVARRQAGTPA
jgi:3-oxoacyl-[acyl-carrier-protein] synthase II